MYTCTHVYTLVSQKAYLARQEEAGPVILVIGHFRPERIIRDVGKRVEQVVCDVAAPEPDGELVVEETRRWVQKHDEEQPVGDGAEEEERPSSPHLTPARVGPISHQRIRNNIDTPFHRLQGRRAIDVGRQRRV